jgi:hypothetical protein
MGASEETVSPAREFAWESWKNLGKRWLDYQSFRRQKHDILSNPAVVLYGPPESNANWKSPMSFAAQGLIVTAAIIQVCSAVVQFALGAFFPAPPPPPSRWAIGEEHIHEVVQELRTFRELVLAPKPSDPLSGFGSGSELIERRLMLQLQRREALRQVREDSTVADALGDDFATQSAPEQLSRIDAAIARQQRDLKVVGFGSLIDKAEEKLDWLAEPAALVVGAYLFGFTVRLGNVRRLIPGHTAQRFYLYVVTATFFWLRAHNKTSQLHCR